MNIKIWEVKPGRVEPRRATKTIDRIAADPRVREAWDEGADGYWIALRAGWSFDFYGERAHTIHEWTARDLLARFRTVRPCDCEECRRSKEVEA